jgi:hypothetical protein
MRLSSHTLGRVAITAFLVYATVVSIPLAMISSGTDTAFSQFWSPVLLIAAVLFIVAIFCCWRFPRGWSFGLGACVLAVGLSVYFNHFAWRVPPPFGLGLGSASSAQVAKASC